MSEAQQFDNTHWTVGRPVFVNGELIGEIEAVDEHEQGASLRLTTGDVVDSSDVEVAL